LIRYADDFVVGLEYRHEAEAFDQALKARLARFGLEVAADKTKTLRFGRNGGPHNGRFDFLGFEFYWEPDRKGQPRVKRRTGTAWSHAPPRRIGTVGLKLILGRSGQGDILSAKNRLNSSV
jgi:hypothetical protein